MYMKNCGIESKACILADNKYKNVQRKQHLCEVSHALISLFQRAHFSELCQPSTIARSQCLRKTVE